MVLNYEVLQLHFMLNKVPNNNDIKRIANIMLNEEPNRNGTTHVVNNVRLTTMGAQQFSIIIMYTVQESGVFTHLNWLNHAFEDPWKYYHLHLMIAVGIGKCTGSPTAS